MEEKTLTREEHKQQNISENQSTKEKKIRIRMLPIWLRLIIVTVLIVVSVTIGAMVGYSVIGDGKAFEVFNKSTWTHISDLVYKEE